MTQQLHLQLHKASYMADSLAVCITRMLEKPACYMSAWLINTVICQVSAGIHICSLESHLTICMTHNIILWLTVIIVINCQAIYLSNLAWSSVAGSCSFCPLYMYNWVCCASDSHFSYVPST